MVPNFYILGGSIMNNRRYEKIKEYTKVAREEIMNSLGYDSTTTDKILMLVVMDMQGKQLSSSSIEYLYGTCGFMNTIERYIFITKIADELISFMEGGPLPEEA
jgi:hypothetical protein